MLFNPDFVHETLDRKSIEHTSSSSLSESYKMFSPTSPSPTRTMIKEANDHLQLLHQRVMELEKTVQDQAEALIKKDELMQQKLSELTEVKETIISDLKQTISTYDQRVKRLEQQCKENSRVVELMNQKCLSAEELDAYIPTLEKLLNSMRKLNPTSKRNSFSGVSGTLSTTSNCVNNVTSAASKSCSTRSRKMLRGSNAVVNNDKSYRGYPVDVATSDGSGSVIDGVTPDRSSSASTVVSNSMGQLAMADLRIGRSFNINSNFSMSEDEDEADQYS